MYPGDPPPWSNATRCLRRCLLPTPTVARNCEAPSIEILLCVKLQVSTSDHRFADREAQWDYIRFRHELVRLSAEESIQALTYAKDVAGNPQLSYLMGLYASQPRKTHVCSRGGWLHRPKAPEGLAGVLYTSLYLHGCLNSTSVQRFLQSIAVRGNPSRSPEAMLAREVAARPRRNASNIGLIPSDWDCVAEALVDATLGMYDFLLLTEGLGDTYTAMLQLLHKDPRWFQPQFVEERLENVRLQAPGRQLHTWQPRAIRYIKGRTETANVTSFSGLDAIQIASAMQLPKVLESSSLDYELWKRAGKRNQELVSMAPQRNKYNMKPS